MPTASVVGCRLGAKLGLTDDATTQLLSKDKKDLDTSRSKPTTQENVKVKIYFYYMELRRTTC